MATLSYDNSVRVWDVSALEHTADYVGKGRRTWLTSIALSDDGSELAIGSGGFQAEILLWEHATNEVVARFANQKPYTLVNALVYSPDQKQIASGSLGFGRTGLISLWDLESATTTRVLTGHRNGTFALAFSPDGSIIASAGAEDGGSIKIWSVNDNTALVTLPGHAGATYSASFSTDGTRLVTGGRDGTVKLWDATNWEVQATDIARDEGIPDGELQLFHYPNPFRQGATIEYSLRQAEHVQLTVYDVLGREVTVLVAGHQSPGRHFVRFDAGNLPSGMYLYTLRTETRHITRTMTLAR